MTAKKEYLKEAEKLRKRIKAFQKSFAPTGYGRERKARGYLQFLSKKSGLNIRLMYALSGYISVQTYFILKDIIDQVEKEYIEFLK